MTTTAPQVPIPGVVEGATAEEARGLVAQVVHVPAGSTLVFFESLLHANGAISSGTREQIHSLTRKPSGAFRTHEAELRAKQQQATAAKRAALQSASERGKTFTEKVVQSHVQNDCDRLSQSYFYSLLMRKHQRYRQRGTLSAVFVTELVPSQTCLRNFKAAYAKATNKRTQLGLHGTSLQSVIGVFASGFDAKRRNIRPVFGMDGDYFTNDLRVAMTYSRKKEAHNTTGLHEDDNFLVPKNRDGEGAWGDEKHEKGKWHNVIVVEQLVENCQERDQATSKESGKQWFVGEAEASLPRAVISVYSA